MDRITGIRNVLFDLDGTLVDSSRTILDSIVHALEMLGVDPRSGPDVQSLIGLPLYDIFVSKFGMERGRSLQAIDIYRDYYDSLNQAGTTVYDGVREGLTVLRQMGFGLFVATVKPTPIAEKVLGDLGLREHFQGVAGASLGPERRDKRSIIAHAVSEFGLSATESVMVGDRDQDVEGARSNGMASVAVSYGFGHPEEFSVAVPDHLVDRFGDIPGLLVPER